MAFLDALRRPEYTGENRCTPCTVVNVAIVALAAVAVWFLSPLLAAVVLLGGLALVALRGYVVPYTPEFAPKLVARLPVAFGPDHDEVEEDDIVTGATGGSGESTDESLDDAATDEPAADAGRDDVLDALLDAGVLHGGESLTLDEEFRAAWREYVDAVDDPATAVRAVRPDAHRVDTYEEGETEYVVVEAVPDDPTSEAWIPRAMALADAAAVRALDDRGVPSQTALAAAPALRQFLQTCPECGGDLAAMQQQGACCGGFGPDGPDEVLACTDCEATVARLG